MKKKVELLKYLCVRTGHMSLLKDYHTAIMIIAKGWTYVHLQRRTLPKERTC